MTTSDADTRTTRTSITAELLQQAADLGSFEADSHAFGIVLVVVRGYSQ
jgi:hypothetical protein